MSRSRKRLAAAHGAAASRKRKESRPVAASIVVGRKCYYIRVMTIFFLKSFEVMSPWDLGGDGKAFFGFHPEEEWYVKLMRK